MALKKWRVINNNKIQTHATHVYLWDKVLGVAVGSPVKSRPWTKLNRDFSHWLPNPGNLSMCPTYPPEGVHACKEQLTDMLSRALDDSKIHVHLPIMRIDDWADEDEEFLSAFDDEEGYE